MEFMTSYMILNLKSHIVYGLFYFETTSIFLTIKKTSLWLHVGSVSPVGGIICIPGECVYSIRDMMSKWFHESCFCRYKNISCRFWMVDDSKVEYV